MYQRWDRLLFLHWEYSPEVIQKALPNGLSVDTFEGRAFLGVVPFFMRNIRPRGLPAIPYLSNFLECNVRTYVHDENGIPGVWFFSLDTDRWLAYKIARLAFQLPYCWAAMNATGSSEVEYSVRRRGTNYEAATYRYGGSRDYQIAESASLEFFLLERYLLYAYHGKKKRLFTGRVNHTPYRYAPVHRSGRDPGPIAWNGFPLPADEPAHACEAEPVDVSVYSLDRQNRSKQGR